MVDGPVFLHFAIGFAVSMLIAALLIWAGHEMFPKDCNLQCGTLHASIVDATNQMVRSAFDSTSFLKDDLTAGILQSMGLGAEHLESLKDQVLGGADLKTVLQEQFVSAMTASQAQFQKSFEDF